VQALVFDIVGRVLTFVGQERFLICSEINLFLKGSIKRLAFQQGRTCTGKLVRVITGKVLDIAVDIRPGRQLW
jgi:dTDP-4-dehydrorhamnose 3,5-epimerase-like enzyme